MDEYVKKSEAIDAVLLRMVSSDNEDTDLYNIALRRAASAIYDIPAADVRSVVRGKWISDQHGKNFGKEVRLDEDGCPVATCHCSVCGEWLTASDEYPAKGCFCPNCGADMRETKHEPVE